MKQFHSLKALLFNWLVTAVCFVALATPVRAQVYATSQTNGVTGLCLLCGVSDPNKAVTNTNLNDYSQFNLTLGLLGVTIHQTLIFSSPGNAAYDSVIVRIGSGNAILSANLFGGVNIQTFNGSTANNDGQFVNASILRLLDNNTIAEITIKPTQAFDRVKLTLHSSLVGLLSSFRIYSALRKSAAPVIPDVIPDSLTICAGDTATFTATAAPGAIIRWYDAPAGGNLLATGSTFIISPATTATYYVEAENGGSLSARIPAKVTVSSTPGPITVSVPASICAGNTATLSVINPEAGTTFRWYDAETGGTLLFTGTSFTTPPLNDTTTYYLEAINLTTGCKRARVSVSVNVNAGSEPLTISVPANICTGNTATFSIVNPQAGATYEWYDAATGGTLLFTGTSFITPPLNDTFTYYVEVTGLTTGCNGGRTSATVNVNSGSIIVSVPASICPGNTATLSIVNPQEGVSYGWYDGATVLLFTGTTFTTPPLNETTTYNIVPTGPATACIGDITTVTVNVGTGSGSEPLTISIPDSICAGNTATLSIVNPQAGVTYGWYDAATGGTLLFTGTSFTTPALNAATTYYVEATGSGAGCNSGRTSATVNVTPGPGPLTISVPGNTCAGNTAKISIINPQPGITFRWYDAATGGTLLFTGTSFTTPPLNVTTTYYVEAINLTTGCKRNRAAPTVKVTACAQTSATKFPSPDELLVDTDDKLVVFPNPTRGEIKLQARQNLAGDLITIFNSQGYEVQRTTLQSNTLTLLPSLGDGIYILRVTTKGKQILTNKIVLSK